MLEIVQKSLPEDMWEPRPLPGIRPVDGSWLRVDDAYAGQMARRRDLLSEQRDDVLWMAPEALGPAQELLEEVLSELPGLGFKITGDEVERPDGVMVTIDRDAPLLTLGHLVQSDFCLLEKVDEEHVLKGAVLCFPASWTLSEKVGKPLSTIHVPVPSYDAQITARVQRLFNGVQPGRPIWRANRLWYADPELHQPRSEHAPRAERMADHAAFFRAERQTIFRLPQSRWVVFAIHTFVLREADVPFSGTENGSENVSVSSTP